MARPIYTDLELKEKFLSCYANVRKYRLNISKILDEIGVSRKEFEYWCSRKDFLNRLKEAQKIAADNLLEEYLSLFLDNKDRQAGELILSLLDPVRFDKDRNENKDTIQSLVLELTQEVNRRVRKPKSISDIETENSEDNSD